MEKIIQKNYPHSKEWACTVQVERYEQEVCNILAALGEINEQYKYSLVTDLTRFEAFTHNPHQPLDEEALRKVSEELGLKISYDTTLVEIARKMFQKRLDSSYVS